MDVTVHFNDVEFVVICTVFHMWFCVLSAANTILLGFMFFYMFCHSL